MSAGLEERIAAAGHVTSVAARRLEEVVAAEIDAMAGAWDAATQEAEAMATKGAAIAATVDDYKAKLARFSSVFPEGRPSRSGPPATLPRMAVTRNPDGSWIVGEQTKNRLEADLRDAQLAAREASQRRFGGGRYRDQAKRSADSLHRTIQALEAEAKRLATSRDDVLRQREAEADDRRAAADRRVEEAMTELASVMRRLPPGMSPWSSPGWLSWSPGLTHTNVLLGMLRPQHGQAPGKHHGFAWSARLPTFVSIREPVELSHRRRERDAALGFARSLMLRALACTPPGKLRLFVFDPTGLGQSVASLLELGEYNRELIGGKIWSSSEDLRRLLSEQTAHIELVIQKYLRAEYATLDEFNSVAGEIAEPYRLLTIIDAPSGFDEAALAQLRRIVENGPRCGVSTLLVTDEDLPTPYGVSLEPLRVSMRTIRLGLPFTGTAGARPTAFELITDTDVEAPAPVAASIIRQTGKAAADASTTAVSFERTFKLFSEAALNGRRKGLPSISSPIDVEDSATWWTHSSVDSISAPIGLRGARDVATLVLDSSDHAGSLLVGRPGSGKSTLLHTFIAGITTVYGPEELELHLIDFREGVEFKVYAAHGLPHARSVAIESDREFGVSVLQALLAEMSWRGSLLRSSSGSHASLESLRKATGERLPRILLVFDEFQVLFARNDKLGGIAADALETLIRQGRGFGMHVILGSQSLAGLDALGSHVPQLLPVRILLPAADSDAFKVLGEGNTEGTRLTTAGEGILNAAGGVVEANERFRGAVTSEDERRTRVMTMRAKADATGFHRRPVVFEGNAPIPADDTPPRQFLDQIRGADARTLRLRFGVPMSIAGTADINLRREAGANMVLVARDAPLDVTAVGAFSVPRAVTTNLILSTLAQGADVEVVDFLPIDEGLETVCAPLLEAGAIQLRRRRMVASVLERLGAEVQRRVDEDDTSGRAMFLTLYGMHRARDFDQDSVDYDAGADIAQLLIDVMRDGPEVGVHTYLWFDTVAAIGRRLPSGALREVSWRLAGKMSADDSTSLLGEDAAASLREQQLVAANDDRGLLQRCTTIAAPSAAWMREVLSAGRRGEEPGV